MCYVKDITFVPSSTFTYHDRDHSHIMAVAKKHFKTFATITASPQFNRILLECQEKNTDTDK